MTAWRQIAGYEGLYEVSADGAVRSVERSVPHGRSGTQRFKARVLTQGTSNSGYLYVGLWREGRVKNHFVHRLVLAAFDRAGLDGEEGNHKDGDKKRNAVGNLEWLSHSENLRHAVNTLGFRPPVPGRGAKNHNARAVERHSDAGARRYPSIADAAADGFRACCIVECCRGTQKSHGGYAWRYADGTGVAP